MPRAVVCAQIGPYAADGVLRLSDTPALGAPPPGALKVRVACAGVGFPHLLTVQGKYQVKRAPPFVPVDEAAGEVVAVGDGVEGWHVGDRVLGKVVSELSVGKARETPDAAALRGAGGLAEEAFVHTKGCMRVPAGLSFEVAVAMENYSDVYNALDRMAALQRGETLLVLGAAGACGLAAVDIGRALGARVVACASSAAKLEACRAAGADLAVDYETGDSKAFIARLKDAGVYGKVNVVFDPVGGRYGEAAFRAVAQAGRYVVFGFAAGGTDPKSAFPNFPINLLLMRGQRILGAMGPDGTGPQGAAREMLEWAADGRLRPVVSRTYPMRDFARAFDDLASRRAVGKVVVSIGGAAGKL